MCRCSFVCSPEIGSICKRAAPTPLAAVIVVVPADLYLNKAGRFSREILFAAKLARGEKRPLGLASGIRFARDAIGVFRLVEMAVCHVTEHGENWPSM